MNKNTKLHFIKAALLICAAFGSAQAFADNTSTNGVVTPCELLPLVNRLILPNHPDNTSVCVDVPVNLKKVKAVFNLDSLATADGSPNGISVGLRHMWMLGNVIKDRIANGLMDADDVSVIGIFHGSSASWGLSDDWWKAQKDAAGNQLYPNGNPEKVWIERLFALKNQGVNIQLEICGVTMFGNGWSNVITDTHPFSDVYSSANGIVHVNQGAIGRLVDLQQHGYVYIQEGYVKK